jgi:hypothetical protein
MVAEKIFTSYGSSAGGGGHQDLARKRARATLALQLIGVDPSTVQFTQISSSIFTGSPGTGKSFCLAFLALVCHCAGVPFKLIGHKAGSVFFGYAVSFGVASDSAPRNEIVHLIDHDVGPYVQKPHKVILTSSDFDRLKDLKKLKQSRVLYMDTWSFQEAEECARSCYDFSEEEVTETLTPLYEKFGGIIRFITGRPLPDEDG